MLLRILGYDGSEADSRQAAVFPPRTLSPLACLTPFGDLPTTPDSVTRGAASWPGDLAYPDVVTIQKVEADEGAQDDTTRVSRHTHAPVRPSTRASTRVSSGNRFRGGGSD
ncbi:hypothetical protein [Mycobacterium sp. URHB0021]